MEVDAAYGQRDEQACALLGLDGEAGEDREAASGEGTLEALRTGGLEGGRQFDAGIGEACGSDRARARRGLPGEVRLGGELSRGHGAAARPGVLGCDHDDELVVGDGDRVEPVECVGALDETDVGAVLAHRVEHAARVDDLELRVEVGALATELREPARQEEFADGVAGTQTQIHAAPGARALDDLRNRVEGFERGLGGGVDGGPERRGAHAEAAAFEQAAAHAALQCLDALGRRRLRQLQGIGCAMHAPGFDRGRERGQFGAGQGVGRRWRLGHRVNLAFPLGIDRSVIGLEDPLRAVHDERMRSSNLSTRRVVSNDASLAPDANALLTAALQEVVGSSTAELPASRIEHTGRRRAKHSTVVAELVDVRLGLVVTVLVLLLVITTVAVGAGGWLVLIRAVVVLLASTAVVLVVVSRMTGESEHLAPEAAAALGEEGVGDRDRAFTDLVADFTVPKDRAADGARA